MCIKVGNGIILELYSLVYILIYIVRVRLHGMVCIFIVAYLFGGFSWVE